MSTLLPLLAGKFTNATIKEFGLGSGSTWPGHIALRINPEFIKHFLQKKNLKIILVAGTNGKTTTSKLLTHILENNDIPVFQNEEGANMVNGLATTLLRNTSVFGKIKGNVAIFEVDENNLPKVLEQITPTAIVFLNLFRDQLDRYGEIHTIAEKWKKALKKLPASTKIILNADDPEIRHLVKAITGKTLYFSIPARYFKKKDTAQDTDSTHCPECGTKLLFSKIAYSHLGKYSCKKCKFTNENLLNSNADGPDDLPSTLTGAYNIYNTQAAVKVAKEIFELPKSAVKSSLQNFIPAFGRQETLQFKKRTIVILLSKNPAGFNQSLSVVLESKTPNVLLALNDRTPDGKDVSWIWDINTEDLTEKAKTIVVTGDRAYDMSLRLKYSLQSNSLPQEYFPFHGGAYSTLQFSNKVQVKTNTKDAVNELVKNTKEGETAYILPTYSAMLEIRKIITGKEIL
jgi:UDP-N-acetylmuramyl tripeptide synthase